MKTTIKISIAIAIYIFITWRTYKVCTPADKEKTKTDKILIPLVSIFWPIPWLFIFGNEVVGFFSRIIKRLYRKKRIAKKELQRLKRLKEMNQ